MIVVKRRASASNRKGQSSMVIGWRVVFHSTPQRGIVHEASLMFSAIV
jgi:hypothetical protein